MTPRQSLAPSTVRPLSLLLLWAALGPLLALAAACGEGGEPAKTPTPTSTPTAAPTNPAALSVTVYKSPTCGCCIKYERYLEGHSFQVESISTEDLTAIKDGLGIPLEMRSCHTVILGDYYVEGHVPVEAIQKLLQERPQIDGIALPGMPAGSPGMGGSKAEPFVIYAIVGGQAREFMSI